MPLTAGTRLGPYEIVAPVGAGGMGTVYRARDTRLDRVVALKVLSDSIAKDEQFRERFEREARTISKLTHPHICTLFDVGEHEGAPFIVMEFLEGETLAARLEHGAQAKPPSGLPLDEALKIAAEVSSALDEAHRAGVVHRDLKPANVMLTRSGAKLLDFGLAKPTASAIVTSSGTIVPVAASGALTATGTIVGTFQYMAPEQLEGSETDARADIFSFGAILFEMITGCKAFTGKNQVSLIGAILKDQPPPISTVVPIVPKALDRIIQACLAKDPDARLRSAHDLVLQIQMVAEGRADREPPDLEKAPAPSVAAGPRTSSIPAVIGAALAGAVAAALITASLLQRNAPAPTTPIQFTIPPPENAVFGFGGGGPAFAVSPDGRQIVFVATTPSGPMLFARSLASLAVRPLPGTEQGNFPFWSPDSQSVAFFAAGKLKTTRITAGSPIIVCDAPIRSAGSWNRDNVILFAPSTSGPLMRVSAAGGVATPATAIDATRGETSHRWPQFLPDGRHFLYVAGNQGQRPADVKVGSLDSKDATTILTADSQTMFASGHVFFWRDGGVMAQPFDAQTLQLKSNPFRVAEQVGQAIGYVSFSASSSGVIAYTHGSPRPISQLTWRDRSGKQNGTVGEPGDYFNIALSRDEKHVAAALATGTPENRDIWSIDLERGVSSRLTFDPAADTLPSWSPDGARIVFGSQRAGGSGLYVKNMDGSGQEELLVKLDEGGNPMDWSPDGRSILYFAQAPKTGFDLWVLPLDGDRKPAPFLQTTFDEDHGAFSPDGRWIAYSSTESGHEDVYVQSFPPNGGKAQVSRNGGTQPMWRGDGRELYFLSPDGTMMAASIDTEHGVQAGNPQALFPSGITFSGNRHQYAVTKDGQRFLINVPQQRSNPTPLTVVVNWQLQRP